jgi:membrane peptidoglycan carboxypeptidase
MLNAVVKAGTGRRADLEFTPQAGKTGTNQSYRDAWFIGFTARNVTGVWFGNDDFSPMNKVTGGLLPAPTWKLIMLQAEKTRTAAALPGIPVDESYAKHAEQAPPAEDTTVALPTIEFTGLPGTGPTIIAPGQQAQGTSDAVQAPRGARSAALQPGAAPIPDESGEEVVIVKPRERRDPVAAVFEDVFNIFGNSDEEPKKKVRTNKSAFELILPSPNTGNGESTLQRMRKKKIDRN